MSNNEKYFQIIIEEIFDIPNTGIKINRKDYISQFIKTVVNGDIIDSYLVVDVLLNNKPGVYVYILTNNRLIQIGIDSENERSLPFLLSKIGSIELKSPDSNRQEVRINFENEVIGLNYSANKQEVTKFFTTVYQAKSQRGFNE